MFSHPFFVAQQTGLKEAAKRTGVAIDVRDGQDDDQKQIVQVEALVNLECAAIILCPRDENAPGTRRRVRQSREHPGHHHEPPGRRRQGRQLRRRRRRRRRPAQGEELVKALGPKGGKIIYLQGTPGSSPQVSRERGLKSVLATHPEIEVASDQFTNFQEDKAKAVMTGLVRRFKPGEIRAIVAQADELALPAAEVARGQGWKDLIVIGFNGTTDAFEAIRAGQMHATILQDAAEQAPRPSTPPSTTSPASRSPPRSSRPCPL